MTTYFKKDYKLMSIKQADKDLKLINLYNQVNGSNINITSVGITPVIVSRK